MNIRKILVFFYLNIIPLILGIDQIPPNGNDSIIYSIYDSYMVREEVFNSAGEVQATVAGVVITKSFFLTIGSLQKWLQDKRNNNQTRVIMGTKRRMVIPLQTFQYNLYEDSPTSPDIGLVQYSHPFLLNSQINSMQIPVVSYNNNETCIAVTWGLKENYNMTYEYPIRTYFRSECLQVYPSLSIGVICFSILEANDNPCDILPGSPIICSGTLRSIVFADPYCVNGWGTNVHQIRLSTDIYYVQGWIRRTIRMFTRRIKKLCL